MEQKEIYETIIRQAESIAPDLQALRRDFHRYPELGWMEMRTSAKIAALLQSYGCDEVLTGRQVCLENARMGVPELPLLESHYEEVRSRGDVDPELMDLVEQVCREKMKLPTRRLPDVPGAASEDYSYLSERVQSHGGQSCYFQNLSKCPSTLHNDHFNFQETALVNGVKAFCGVAVSLSSPYPDNR